MFDCSLPFKGVSLNSVLWKGPDLANTTVGTLLRFRLHEVAVTADIEKMYHMIKLPVEDRDFLRFLWYKGGDIDSNPVEYRLTVHLFGATTSSSIANFALKKSVEFCKDQTVKELVEKSFYVDDLMASFPDEKTAVKSMHGLKKQLKNHGFNLTAISSNSKQLIRATPNNDLSKNVKCIDINRDNLPDERTLGIKWDPEVDTFGYYVNLPQQPNTKRGILSTIFSLYDPLFLASPALIPAKKIFQETCQQKLGWDEELPTVIEKAWTSWKRAIIKLNDFCINRCYKMSLKNIQNVQLHIFCDGSEIAYGAVAYLRFENAKNEVVTAIVLAKSRLTPIDRSSLKTVPRIELNAAKVAVNLYEKIKQEFNGSLEIDSVFFWTDSVSTLQYIRTENTRLQRFIANRVAYILQMTDTQSWRHVPGTLNPADLLSRGTKNMDQFIHDSCWVRGPEFLKDDISTWPEIRINKLGENDDEIKNKQLSLCAKETNAIEVHVDDATDKLMKSTSNLYKLKLRIATFLKFKQYLRNRSSTLSSISSDDVEAAENELYKYCQRIWLPEIHSKLVRRESLPKKHYLVKFDPFLDSNGIIRIRGRLRKALIPYDSKHPIVLHASSFITRYIVNDIHQNQGHLGKETIATTVKEKYHIIKCAKLITNVLRNCMNCRKTQGKPSVQIMADLPSDRIIGDHPPFTNSATDLFGPFYVSKGRGKMQEKRYGVIFTCLTSRATHIEITPSLDTNSFINAMRRFICRRGTPKLIRSDNGTNLTSAEKELKQCSDEWNRLRIDDFCKKQHINWIFQPPNASHFGGVFERQIRTIRKIFSSLLQDFACQVRLTDDLLNTLFCEVENIMNSKPLILVNCNPSENPVITPNTLLRLQTNVEFPPGVFSEHDLINKRQWRQAQFLADVFWHRWRKEYLSSLNQRQKWLKRHRSHFVGDIVLILDNSLPRNLWNIGIIRSVRSDDHGDVRSVEVDVVKYDPSNKVCVRQKLVRPVNKLVLLHEAENTLC